MRAVVSLGIDGLTPPGHPAAVFQNYRAGLQRIRAGLSAHNFQGEFLAWDSGYPAGCPPHHEVEYAFKPFCMYEAYQRGYTSLLWLDSSLVVLSDLSRIFHRLDELGYIFVRNSHSVGEYCKDEALVPLGITREESFGIPSCAGGVLGLALRHERSLAFLRQWRSFAADRVTFPGPKWSGLRGFPSTASSDPRVKGHRHDQTVASVIAWRLRMNQWCAFRDLAADVRVDRVFVRQLDEPAQRDGHLPPVR